MGSKQKKLIVFASGSGSNFRAICRAVSEGHIDASIEALIVNVPACGAVSVANEFKLPVHEIAHQGKARVDHEAEVLATLDRYEFDWIVLAGYMRLLSENFIDRFWDEKLEAARIVNIHPSLLPAFAGKDGYGQALRYGVSVTGSTVHLVSKGLDDGPIVSQRAIEIFSDDTEARLRDRGLLVEHALYVQTLSDLVSKKWKVLRKPDRTGRPRVVFE